MAVRITIIADEEIEELSAREIEIHLWSLGIEAQRTRITRLSEKQHVKALT